MVMLLLWTSAFILCTQPLISHAEGTVESAMIDPFELGRVDSSEVQETREWLDPFDMTGYSHAEKRMVKEHRSNEPHNYYQCETNTMEKNFLQRLVNLLINHSQNEETSILLTVTSSQLQELYHLKDASDSEATIRVLNGIFSYMTVQEKTNFIMDIFISEEVWSNIAAMSFAVLPLCVFIISGTMRRVVIILSLSIFAVSYFKTQKLMLKQLEVQNERTLLKANECVPRQRSWFNFFGRDNEAECIKQLHAQKIDPSLEVTPFQVIMHMTTVGLLQPMDHFGVMFTRFSRQIFETHSLLSGWFVLLIGAFIMIYFITACYAGIFGRGFSIGNRYMSFGMTGSAQLQSLTEEIPPSVEPAPESQVATKPLLQVPTKPNTEQSVVNYVHHPQPVIQIIHNYSSRHVDEPTIGNDDQTKQVTSDRDKSSISEMKSIESVEESHKICEVTPDSCSTKHDTTKASESVDGQNK